MTGPLILLDLKHTVKEAIFKMTLDYGETLSL